MRQCPCLLTLLLWGIPSRRSSLKGNTHTRWSWVPHPPPDLAIRSAPCQLSLKLGQAQKACPSCMPTAEQMEQKLPQAACSLPWRRSGRNQRLHGPQGSSSTQTHPGLYSPISQFLSSGDRSMHSCHFYTTENSSPRMYPHLPQPWQRTHTNSITTKM